MLRTLRKDYKTVNYYSNIFFINRVALIHAIYFDKLPDATSIQGFYFLSSIFTKDKSLSYCDGSNSFMCLVFLTSYITLKKTHHTQHTKKTHHILFYFLFHFFFIFSTFFLKNHLQCQGQCFDYYYYSAFIIPLCRTVYVTLIEVQITFTQCNFFIKLQRTRKNQKK